MKKNLKVLSREKSPTQLSKTYSSCSSPSYNSKYKSPLKTKQSPNCKKQKSISEQNYRNIINEINSLWIKYNEIITNDNSIQLLDFELSFRMFLYKYDITKDYNLSLIHLTGEINNETEIIFINEKIWLMHLFILVNLYNINFSELLKVYNDIFKRFSFTKKQYMLLFKQFTSFIDEGDIKKYMKEIPKHFVELLSNNNDKQCYLNEQSNQNKNNNGMGYNVHLKINDIINEINKENLIEDKLISLTQITVLEGNNIFKQITGQNCAFTPVKKHIDKNKFEEEQKKLREVYGDEGIYIPFNEEILNTIHKTNTRHQKRFSFGLNDSLPN